MQFDTLRLRIIETAARVVELKQQVRIHRPSTNPDQRIFSFSIERLPCLAAWPTGQRAQPNHSSFKP